MPHADLVYEEIKQRTNAAILQLVEKEREGELIDRTLVKNILGIFIDVGMGGMEYYERDFEAHLLLETATFYKRKAAQWIEQDSCPDYLIKAEQCLKEEEERVDNYLHSTTKQKLLKEVENEVLTKYEAVLLQKEHSGCAALLRDDKVGHGFGGRGGMRGGGAEPTGKLLIQHMVGLQGEAARWRGSAEGCFESHKGWQHFCRASTHTTVSMDLTLQPPATSSTNRRRTSTNHHALLLTPASDRGPGAHVPPVPARAQGSGACGGHLQGACGA